MFGHNVEYFPRQAKYVVFILTLSFPLLVELHTWERKGQEK